MGENFGPRIRVPVVEPFADDVRTELVGGGLQRRDVVNVGHRRKKKRCLGTLHKRFHQPSHQLGRAGALAYRRGNAAVMETRGYDARPFKPSPNSRAKRMLQSFDRP